MKYQIIAFFCLFHSSIIMTKRPPRPPKPGRTENARIVVGNLAQIIGHIGNIVENPHNADNVGNSVSNIVDNIITITVNAVQNKTIEMTDAYIIMEELYALCKDSNHHLAQQIMIKKNRLFQRTKSR